MRYIHVKNIEKYHPKFKDRKLSWCKLYFTTLNSDPAFMRLHETDKWRFFALVMLELQLGGAVPEDKRFLSMKGFDFVHRHLEISLKCLENFIVIDNKMISECHGSGALYKEEVYKEEKNNKRDKDISPQIEDLLMSFGQNGLKEKVKSFLDLTAKHNKTGKITSGKTCTILLQLANSRDRCANDAIFSEAIDGAIKYDAPNIGYVNAIIRNKKTKVIEK